MGWQQAGGVKGRLSWLPAGPCSTRSSMRLPGTCTPSISGECKLGAEDSTTVVQVV